MNKGRFGSVALVFTFVGIGALAGAEGCTVTVSQNTCNVSADPTIGCMAGQQAYSGCQNGDTPIYVEGTCAAGSGAGNFCCTPRVQGDGGGNDSSTDSGPKADGGDGGGGNACYECLGNQCTGQWGACASNADCLTIYTCATKTGCDQNCVNDCFNASPGGQNAYLALSGCDTAAECGVCQATCMTPSSTCAPADGGMPDDASAVMDCTTCTSTSCASEKSACAMGTMCYDYTQCLAVCKDAACIDACGLANMAGKTASEALGACVSMNCAMQCGL